MALQIPGAEAPQERMNLLRGGFQGLKRGALYFIIVTILGMLVYAGLLAEFLLGGRGFETGALGDIAFSSVGFAGIAMGVIALMGLIEWMKAGRYFAEYDPLKLGYGYTGPRLLLYGVIMLLIAVMASGLIHYTTRHTGTASGFAAAFALGLLIIGVILALVGWVMFGVFLIQLDELRAAGLAVGGFKLAGLLWIIGLIINILNIIAVILVYIYSGDTLRRLGSPTPESPQPSPSPPTQTSQ